MRILLRVSCSWTLSELFLFYCLVYNSIHYYNIMNIYFLEYMSKNLALGELFLDIYYCVYIICVLG